MPLVSPIPWAPFQSQRCVQCQITFSMICCYCRPSVALMPHNLRSLNTLEMQRLLHATVPGVIVSQCCFYPHTIHLLVGENPSTAQEFVRLPRARASKPITK